MGREVVSSGGDSPKEHESPLHDDDVKDDDEDDHEEDTNKNDVQVVSSGVVSSGGDSPEEHEKEERRRTAHRVLLKQG